MHRHAFDLHPAKQHFHRHPGQRPPAPQARECEIVGLHLASLGKHREGAIGQGNTMFAIALHPDLRNRPKLLADVDFSPMSPKRLSRTRCSQDDELKGQRSSARLLA